jgi:sorting nexin-1/2
MSNSKFAQMVEEVSNQFKIPHYGDLAHCHHYEVIKPCLINNKYVAYQVKGEDNLDSFEGMRRYNEFFTMRQVLCARWPGLFVPCIPPKKAVGNKDVRFIVERRYFLERFLKQMSQYSILVNSEEFRIFARPELAGGHSDVQGQLSKLAKLAPEDIAKRFYDGFGMNDVMFKASADKQQEYEYSLKEFEGFLKKLMA